MGGVVLDGAGDGESKSDREEDGLEKLHCVVSSVNGGLPGLTWGFERG